MSSIFSPLVEKVSKAKKDQLDIDLFQANIQKSPEEWITYAVRLGIIMCFLITPAVLMWALENDPPMALASLPLGLFFGYGIYASVLNRPSRIKARYAREFECDLGNGLMNLGIALNQGTSFMEALRMVAESDFGLFSKHLKKTLREFKAGIPIQEALDRLGREVDSLLLRQACDKMLAAYIHSTGKAKASIQPGDPLIRLAEQMFEGQSNELKLYLGQAAVISQSAVVFCVVLPVMAAGVIIMFSAMFGPIFQPPELMTLLFGVGFTGVFALLYRIQFSKIPIFLRRDFLLEQEKGRFIERTMEDLQYKMNILRFGLTPELFIRQTIMFSLIAGLFVAAVIFTQFNQPFYAALSFISISAITFFLYFNQIEKRFQAIQTNIEDNLPGVLEQTAQSTSGHLKTAIQSIAKYDYGIITDQFKKALRAMDAGESLEEALSRIPKETGSKLMKFATDMLIRAHKTGMNMNDALLMTATYVRKIKSLFQESRSATYTERLSQIMGYIMAAALFGSIVTFGSIFSGIGDMGVFGKPGGAMAIEAVEKGLVMALLIMPFIIGDSVATLEGDKNRRYFYVAFLWVTGPVIYYLSKFLMSGFLGGML